MINYTLKELLECRMLMTSQNLDIGKLDVAIQKIIEELTPIEDNMSVPKRKPSTKG